MVDMHQYQIKSFSLDWTDDKYDSFVSDMLAPRPRLLLEIVAQDPTAATKCFHYTVRLVAETLFHCSPSGSPYPDGLPAKLLSFQHTLRCLQTRLGVLQRLQRRA